MSVGATVPNFSTVRWEIFRDESYDFFFFFFFLGVAKCISRGRAFLSSREMFFLGGCEIPRMEFHRTVCGQFNCSINVNSGSESTDFFGSFINSRLTVWKRPTARWFNLISAIIVYQCV